MTIQTPGRRLPLHLLSLALVLTVSNGFLPTRSAAEGTCPDLRVTLLRAERDRRIAESDLRRIAEEFADSQALHQGAVAIIDRDLNRIKSEASALQRLMDSLGLRVAMDQLGGGGSQNTTAELVAEIALYQVALASAQRKQRALEATKQELDEAADQIRADLQQRYEASLIRLQDTARADADARSRWTNSRCDSIPDAGTQGAADVFLPRPAPGPDPSEPSISIPDTSVQQPVPGVSSAPNCGAATAAVETGIRLNYSPDAVSNAAAIAQTICDREAAQSQAAIPPPVVTPGGSQPQGPRGQPARPGRPGASVPPAFPIGPGIMPSLPPPISGGVPKGVPGGTKGPRTTGYPPPVRPIPKSYPPVVKRPPIVRQPVVKRPPIVRQPVVRPPIVRQPVSRPPVVARPAPRPSRPCRIVRGGIPRCDTR